MKEKIAAPTCEQLIDSFPDPFVIIDRNYTIIAANTQYARHYGTEAKVLSGQHCYQVSHHLQSPCSEHGEHCPLEELFRTGETTQVMHIHYDADGNEERVQINATPLFDDEGRLQFMGESLSPVQNVAIGELIVGHSPAMQMLLQQIQRVAQTRTTVLLTGESGSGKNCMAQYLHSCSGRETQPFVVVDCAALKASDIERELFGFERGAISGVDDARQGVFERASGGTLFIDEIGDLPLASQNKLLRVLETNEIKRLGASEYQSVDVRIVVASNRDLQKMVSSGAFRKDLYYRLSAFPVCVPPLRTRQSDVLLLAEHFLSKMEDVDFQSGLDDDVKRALMSHNYPGNVRELRNLIERAVIYAAGERIQVDHLVFDHDLFGDEIDQNTVPDSDMLPIDENLELLSRCGDRPTDQQIMSVLSKSKGHRADAAKKLGISERTLYRHIKRLRSAAET